MFSIDEPNNIYMLSTSIINNMDDNSSNLILPYIDYKKDNFLYFSFH